MKIQLVLFIFVLLQIVGAEERLPRVLILGDSIYQPIASGASSLLQGRVEVVYRTIPPGEVRNTTTALLRLDEWIGEEKWDLIHFNFGLGDLVHRASGMKSFRIMPRHAGGIRTTTPETYQKNLHKIVNRLKETGAKLVWANTTPIRASASDVFELGSEVKYNEIAAKVMGLEEVPVNDMFSYTVDLIDMDRPASHGFDPFYFDRKPMYPPVVRCLLKELGLMRPVKGPVKVFLMVGGWAHIGGGVVVDPKKPRPGSPKGSLDELVLNPKTEERFRSLLTSDGNWATRPDVWISFDRRGPKSGTLGIGYGGDRKRGIGSELGLGQVLGDYYDEQVCVIKTTLNTPSLVEDLSPPATGVTGKSYQLLLNQVNDSLVNLQNKFPDYTVQSEYEICGLILNLGENDTDAKKFEEILPLLIKDLRKDLKAENLPVVIVGSGRGGVEEPSFPEMREAQQAVAGRPDLRETVRYLETLEFWPPESERSASRAPSFERWYDHSGSFLKMGHAIGKLMLEIVDGGD